MQKFTIYPTALRFSQSSLRPYLSFGGKNVPLRELLRNGVKPSDFPPLNVSLDKNGVMWTNENGILWLFRKAKIREIQVVLSSGTPPADRDRMSKLDYFPKLDEKSSRVDPDKLRFSCVSLPADMDFKGKPLKLAELRTNLENHKLKPSDFPPLDVYKARDGTLWCNDNRALWLFRKAKSKARIKDIEVRVYDVHLNKAPPEEQDRGRMSKPDYFPRFEIDTKSPPAVNRKSPPAVKVEIGAKFEVRIS